MSLTKPCTSYNTLSRTTGSNWDHRDFLNFKVPPFNAKTINFLETMNGGTDWYDQA
jgi:hypothetical protein